jgi:hypothetical protein
MMARIFALLQSKCTHHYLSTASQQYNLLYWLVFALFVINKGADWQGTCPWTLVGGLFEGSRPQSNGQMI